MRLALLLVSLFTAAAARAEGFATFNQSSFARAAALPVLGGAPLLAVGESQTRVTLDWVSEYVEQQNAREALTLDAESQRLALAYRRGFGGSIVSVDGWEWGVELPLVSSGGGMLDSVIENWHDWFGLPNGGRDQAPRDRYLIRYQRDGGTVLDLDRGKTGLGDARLSLGAALGEGWVLRAMLQLPTGDADRLTGGHAGGALWTDYSLPLGETQRARLTLSAGVSAADTGGPLGSQQEPVVGLAGIALNLPLVWGVEGVTQFNFHSALYRGSQLDPLDGPSGQLAFGVRIPWAGGAFTLGVQEDVVVNASPDFSLHFALGFGRSAGDRSRLGRP